MENNSAFNSFELQLTEHGKSFIAETARWAKFLAIVGFVFIGLIVLFALFMFMGGSALSSLNRGINPMGGAAAMGGVLYLVIALLYFLPTRYLYVFADKTKKALAMSNTAEFTEGLSNLKSCFKFMGILMIVVLSFYALALLLVIAGVAGSM